MTKYEVPTELAKENCVCRSDPTTKWERLEEEEDSYGDSVVLESLKTYVTEAREKIYRPYVIKCKQRKYGFLVPFRQLFLRCMALAHNDVSLRLARTSNLHPRFTHAHSLSILFTPWGRELELHAKKIKKTTNAEKDAFMKWKLADRNTFMNCCISQSRNPKQL